MSLAGLNEAVSQPKTDDPRFADTLEQLNKAVTQKQRLEAKLLRIKEKIKQAKNIRKASSERITGRQHHSHTISDVATEDIYAAMRGPCKTALMDEFGSHIDPSKSNLQSENRSGVDQFTDFSLQGAHTQEIRPMTALQPNCESRNIVGGR